MRFTFGYNAPIFKSMFSLNVDLSTCLWDIESQLIIAKCKEEIFDQTRKQIATRIACRSQKPYFSAFHHYSVSAPWNPPSESAVVLLLDRRCEI